MPSAGERCPVCQREQRLSGPICRACQSNLDNPQQVVELLNTEVSQLTNRQREMLRELDLVTTQTILDDFATEGITVGELIMRARSASNYSSYKKF